MTATAVQVQYRRGTAAQVAAFTGAQGEMVVDTTNNRVVIQDGATAGGFAAAKLSEVSTNTRTAVNDAAYAVLATDRMVAYTALTAARIVSLPAASAYPTGTILWIVDESGSCSSSNTITVNHAGSDTINGGTSATLNVAYGYMAIESNGVAKWTIVPQATSGSRTPVSDANYAALTSDRNIAYIAITAARAVSLPAAASFPVGIRLVICDQSGLASATNTITVNRAGSDTIDGGTSAVVKTAYGFLALESNGSNAWTVLDSSSITSGTIDNVVIGGVTPAAASVTPPAGGDASARAITSAWHGQNLPGGFLSKVRNGTIDVWGRGTGALTVGTGGTVTSGAITTLGSITGGSLYTNGTYTAVPLTGGSGTGAQATVIVSGGAVTTVTLTALGTGYLTTDTLSAAAANIGGTGSGFSVPVSALLSLSTKGYAGADGWIVLPTGASVTAQQAAGRALTTNSLLVTGATSVTDVIVKQRIESSVAAPLTSQTVTVQAQVYNNTGATITPTLTVKHATGVDNWGGTVTDVNAVSLQACANGGWTQVAYTFAASSASANGLEISFDFGNNFSTTGKSIQLTEVDLRATPGASVGLNSNPPPPELRPVVNELIFCKRYFYQWTPTSGSATFATGFADSTTTGVCALYFPTEMRANPSFVFAIASTFALRISGAGALVGSTGPTLSATSRILAQINIVVASGLTQGQGLFLRDGGSATSLISASAEL